MIQTLLASPRALRIGRAAGLLGLALAVVLAACSADSGQRSRVDRVDSVARLDASAWKAVHAWERELRYPPAPAGDVVDVLHGEQVPDPYRWLEDSDSPETGAWVAAENELTFGLLERIPTREARRERLSELWNYERFSTPTVRGERAFFTKNDGLQDQSVLYVADAGSGPQDPGRVLLDPNTFSTDGTVALAASVPSPAGHRLAYATSDGGSDWRTWRFLDVETGALLPDVITRNKFGGLEWVEGGEAVVYTRFAAPAQGRELTESNLPAEIVRHVLGTAETEDRVLRERPPEGRSAHVSLSSDRRMAIVGIVDTATRKNEIEVVSLLPGAEALGVHLITGFDAQYRFVGNTGTRLWFQTDLDAPNWRILEIDLAQPSREHWKELVPEAEEAMQAAAAVGGRLVLQYLKDASSTVRVHDLDGTLAYTLSLPGLGSTRGFEGELSQDVTYYSFTSFTTPAEIWRLDVPTGETELYRCPQVDFDPSRYVTEQVFFESRDGTRVPLFIVHAKGLEKDGSHPVLLYGYGGFNIPMTPSFSVPNLVWIEAGGVYVVANLRGGSEYGEAWHEAGTKLQKQNVFDDFISAAEWLVANDYTRPERLAISGGSNGGLLVGACMTQRPDLFGACLPAVGVMDMLRYHLFTIGWAWAGDYGTVADEAEFRALLAYSPYHNLEPGTAYPATLVTTADHDDRVVPAHSFKFAARLQEAQAGPEPVLIRIETRAGHGAGKPTSMRIEEAADRHAFLDYALGLRGAD